MINLNSKFSQSNKINKLLNLHKNSYILSLPSILGIILALVAFPVQLQINGKSDYGNYIFFHFVISFGLLLNLGINKIVAIEIAKRRFIIDIINECLKLSFKIILVILLISLILHSQLRDYYNIFIIGIGLSITVFYLTLESILQGFKNFKLLSIVNFVFYGKFKI